MGAAQCRPLPAVEAELLAEFRPVAVLDEEDDPVVRLVGALVAAAVVGVAVGEVLLGPVDELSSRSPETDAFAAASTSASPSIGSPDTAVSPRRASPSA